MKKILIIDDNEEFKEMIKEYFSSLNYEVILAENGINGIKKAIENLPDLIFLDIMMPDKTGIEVIKELQTYDDTRKIPVFIITGTYLEENMQDAFKMEINFKEFLSKNINLDSLKKKVEKTI